MVEKSKRYKNNLIIISDPICFWLPSDITYDKFINVTYLYVEYHQVYYIDIKSCRIIKDIDKLWQVW